mmetsp:Transcript_18434/g.55601  ORF Transcript_18434/g.55601 Transcript_18434/m.55601 type:complete len:401 (+) Transcript_18434:144-1346(+)
MGGVGELASLQAAIRSGGGLTEPACSTAQRSAARPELLNEYWSAYLTQLQLVGHQASTAAGPPAAPSPRRQQTDTGPTALMAELQFQLQQQQRQQEQQQQQQQQEEQQKQLIAAAVTAQRDREAVQIVLSSPHHVWQPAAGVATLAGPTLLAASTGAPLSSVPSSTQRSAPTLAPARLQLKVEDSPVATGAGRSPTAQATGQRLGSGALPQTSLASKEDGHVPVPVIKGRRTGGKRRMISEAQPHVSPPQAVQVSKKQVVKQPCGGGGGDDDGGTSADEAAEIMLLRMRSSNGERLATASDSGGAAFAAGGSTSPPHSSDGAPLKCSKEKNRQAQRRFRERQKTLIGDLREQVGGLQNDLARQANQLFVVQEENRLLKALLQECQNLQPGPSAAATVPAA